MDETDARRTYPWWGVLADLNAAVAQSRTKAEQEFADECLAQGDAGLGIALALQVAVQNGIHIPADLLELAASAVGDTPWPITDDVTSLLSRTKQRELVPA